MAASVALFFLNLAFAETDRPELLTRTFDHKYLVKYLGPYLQFMMALKQSRITNKKHWLLKMT